MIYSKYPFLDKAKQYIPKEGFTEQYIHYAYNHLWDQAPKQNFPQIDVQVFLISLILLKNTDNNRIYKRWIELFCKKFESLFLKDIYVDKTVRNEVLLTFGIQEHDDIKYYPTYCSMKNTYYLQFIKELTKEEDFKLVNQAQSKGRVNLYYQRFVLILREKLERIILGRIKERYTSNELINQYSNELRKKYPVRIFNAPKTNGQMPPCMLYLIELAQKEHDLSHQQRMVLGMYMMGKKFEMDDILEIFAQLADYKEKTTTYQLNKLSNYNCYSCEKMINMKMCRKDLDSTGKCKFINNPFHY